MTKLRDRIGAVLLLGLCGASGALAANDKVLSEPAAGMRGDYVVAGGQVEISKEVDGDVYAAGGSILLKPVVRGDAVMAGGNLMIQGEVRDDLYAAGGSVVLDGQVGGNATLAAGQLSVAPEASIKGKAALYGANIDVKGQIAHDLLARGEVVRLGGEIQGNVDVIARQLEILPGAKISGKLTYQSPQQAQIAPGAEIGGGISYTPFEARDVDKGVAKAVAVLMVGLFIAGLMVLGGLLMFIWPKFTLEAAQTIAADPGKSLLIGFVLLFMIPITGVLFMITIIGIPVGLLLFFLYPIMLLLGYLTTALYVGDKGMSMLRKDRALTLGWRYLGLIVTLLLFAVLQAIPVLGGLFMFLLLLLGMGAFMLQLYRLYTRSRVKAA